MMTSQRDDISATDIFVKKGTFHDNQSEKLRGIRIDYPDKEVMPWESYVGSEEYENDVCLISILTTCWNINITETKIIIFCTSNMSKI